ncbi:MAG: type II toxin-antitoxin system VapC family toxin [Candidatus Scalindua sp.]
MNGKLLLDTNVIVALFARDQKIHELLANADEVFVPSIAIGELYYGAYKSSRVKENIDRINEFSISNTVLACNIETAQRYGKIKNSLREKGQPIPENDIWIAATAQQYDLTLVTNDTHFNVVENLKIEGL